MKRIVAFCEGDSNNLATWSNVPYLCLKSIENIQRGGYQIERVNISFDALNPPSGMKYAQKIYSLFIRLFSHAFHKRTMLNYSRTLKYQNFVKTRMNQALECYAPLECYAQLVFGFSHVSTDRRSPIILLCDWSIEYKITEQWKRPPSRMEQKIIERQWQVMDEADAIVTLFPHSCDMLKNRFGDKVHYFGHVINSLVPYDSQNWREKFESNRILFIGRPLYKSGLSCLIETVNRCNDCGMNLGINVIGMKRSDIDSTIDASCCDFYGYLNKSDEGQRDLYYKLLGTSKMLVNVTDGWNGASSILEACYYGLPVIVSENEEINHIFSGNHRFAIRCEPNNVEVTAQHIQSVLSLNEPEYKKVSTEGHEFASQYTWDKFSEQLLNLIDLIHLKKYGSSDN